VLENCAKYFEACCNKCEKEHNHDISISIHDFFSVLAQKVDARKEKGVDESEILDPIVLKLSDKLRK